jgi:putative flippase GtrA
MTSRHRVHSLSKVGSLLATQRELPLYIAIGASAVALDVAIYTALVVIFGAPPLFANTISVPASILYSFLGNVFFNFRIRSRMLQRFISFVTVCAVGYLISSAMIWAFVEVLAIGSLLSKAMTVPVVNGLQYAANKYVTFGQAQSSGSPNDAST